MGFTSHICGLVYLDIGGNIERHHQMVPFYRCSSTYTMQATFSGHPCVQDLMLIHITIWSSDYRLLRLVVPNRHGSHLSFHY